MTFGPASTAVASRINTQEGSPQFSDTFQASDQIDSASAAEPFGWSGSLRSSCDNGKLSGTRSKVCVIGTDRRTYRKGEAVAARIAWSHVPAGSAIMVYLERDDPRRDLPYLGPVGALSLSPFPASGAGESRFVWNGRQFPCAPTDLPMLCANPAEIGRYRLRAVLYDSTQLSVVGWPDPTPPKVLAHSASRPFLVDGMPDLKPIARSLWWAALNTAMNARQIDASSALAGDMNGSGLMVLQRGHDRLCAQVPGSPPYESSLEACLLKSAAIGEAGLLAIKPEDAQVTGSVGVRAGSLSRDVAVQLAQKAADPPYRRRVAFHRQPQPGEAGYSHQKDGDFYAWSRAHPFATTYLSDSVSETIFRPDLGGSWIIVVNEIMAGGSLDDSERFADKVLVLVRSDRVACVIETKPYRGEQFAADPATNAFSCR
jgi:hypothetical protein